MDNKKITAAVMIVLVVLAAMWLKRYFSPEQVVRRQLAGAVEAFENEQLLGIVSVISRQYRDRWGQSYESIAGNMSEIMASFDDLSVDLDVKQIDLVGQDVRVRLGFVVTGHDGTGPGYVVGSLTDQCTATLLWREEPQGWRLTTTEALDIPELREELARMESSSS